MTVSANDITAIFEKSRQASRLGEVANIIQGMEKAPYSLRALADFVSSERKRKPEQAEMFNAADAGRNNVYAVTPNWLYVEEGFNLRPVDPERAEMFKEAYLYRPQSVPPMRVKVKVVNGVTSLKIIDGHHRYVGLMLAIAEGADFQKIIVEEFTGGADDEVFNVIESANTKLLEFVQRAEGFKRLVGMGHKEADIAKRLNLSVTIVRRSLMLVDAGENIKALVRDGIVSGDTAADVIEDCQGTDRDPYEELLKAQRAAQEAGKTRITRKFIKSKSRVSLKPKQLRATFDSLMPTLDQLRSQIPPAPSGEQEGQTEMAELLPEDVTLKMPLEQARVLMDALANLEQQKRDVEEAEDANDNENAENQASAEVEE